METRLKEVGGWWSARGMKGVRNLLKVSELNNVKERAYQESLRKNIYSVERWGCQVDGNVRKMGRSGEPWCICKRIFHDRGHFCLLPVFFRTALKWLIAWRRNGCRYLIRIWYTVKRAQLQTIKALVPSIWVKGCMFDNCA